MNAVLRDSEDQQQLSVLALLVCEQSLDVLIFGIGLR